MPPDDADFLDSTSPDFRMRMRLAVVIGAVAIAFWAVLVMLVRRLLGM